MRKDLETVAKTYTASISAHGVTPQGVLWPNAADLATRFEVLTGLLDLRSYSAAAPARLLDLGCGPGFLLDYLAANGLLERVDYTGIDVLEATLAPARKRWPGQRFELRDIRDRPFAPETFDVCIACGVFTVKFENSFADAEAMAHETLRAVWPAVTTGVAFNAMSTHVDWQRDDLFHWALDDIVAFCKANLSRHVAIRMNYGLWESSTLVLKAPVAPAGTIPDSWRAEPA